MPLNKLQMEFDELLSPKQKKWGLGPDGKPLDQSGLTRHVVDLILKEAVFARASDIHIEPEEGRIRVRFRIDGKLYEVLRVDDLYKIPVINRIAVMSGLQTDAMMKREAQDGRFSLQMAGRNYDFRVGTFPTVRGERLTIRILCDDVGLFDLTKIGLDQHDQNRIDQLLLHKQGLVIVSGPTGSGKTTTMYAILNRINSPQLNIMTLENPVEYKIEGMNQCDIKAKSDFQFAEGLRAILRQDPDIILVGEIRDKETADIALRAALTGHLVFSSLHANSAIGTVIRLLNMGLEPYIVSYAMVASIAQRLIRQICPQCKAEHPLNIDLLRHLEKEYHVDPNLLLSKDV